MSSDDVFAGFIQNTSVTDRPTDGQTDTSLAYTALYKRRAVIMGIVIITVMNASFPLVAAAGAVNDVI